MKKKLIALGTAAMLAASTQALAKVAELTFVFADDDPDYIQFMEEKTKEFSAQNKDINIKFVSSGYSYTLTQLPIQLAVGEGPDIVKATNKKLLEHALDLRPYLSDRKGFEALHGNSLKSMIEPIYHQGDEINGFVASSTVNLPFVNKTLFDQAEVPIPGEGYTLNELVEASAKVAEKTGVEVPFTMDRSGHRLMGLMLSNGSHFTKDGVMTFPDEKAKETLKEVNHWIEEGYFPKSMWGSAGGQQYVNMGNEFINGNAVTYFSGNWMVNAFDKQIGNFFEWELLPTPKGADSNVAWTGETYMIPLKRTKHPEAVTKFIEYLGSEKIQREISERFLILTGAQIEEPQFQTDNPSVMASLQNARASLTNNPDYVADLRTDILTAQVIGESQGRMIANFTRSIVGEISLEQSFKSMEKDMVLFLKDLCMNMPHLDFCSTYKEG